MARVAITIQDHLAHASPALQTRPIIHDPTIEGSYAILVCIFVSLGGLLFFGYDQGVTGGVLVMDSFLNDFCIGWDGLTFETCHAKFAQLPDSWIYFTIWYNVSYNFGCMGGALLGGYIAETFGRRMTIFQAGLLFCIGTTWVCYTPSQHHIVLLCGRVIQGVGVGITSFSLPLFGSEIAPKRLRGFLLTFMQMTIVTGVLLANIVNQFVKYGDNGWRTSNAVVMVAPLTVVLGIFFVPESPCWAYSRQGKDAAETILKQLRQTDNVQRELRDIGDQMTIEQNGDWRELRERSVVNRVLVAMFLHALQQATGINFFLAYGGLIFQDIVGDGTWAVLLLSVVNFFTEMLAMRWVDISGRRQLLLVGSTGMVLGHLLSAIVFTTSCDGGNTNTGAVSLSSGCPTRAGYLVLLGTSFFVANFAASWGPVCWIYPAEIFPLAIRAKAVSLSVMANWVMGTALSYVAKLFPLLNIHGVFFLFSITCAGSGIFVYYLCPETKDIHLKDIEASFQSGVPFKQSTNPVRKRNATTASPVYMGVALNTCTQVWREE